MRKILKRIVIIAVLLFLLIAVIQIILWLKIILGMYFTDHLI